MSGFFWNIRGFNKKEKQSVVKKWVEEKGFQFGALLETRVKEGRSQRILSSVFNGWSMISNYEYNLLGRIWLVWRSDVRVTPVYKSDQLITVSVGLNGGEDEFLLSTVYALNTEVERRVLWEDLKRHHNSAMFSNKPWLIIGDFNETLNVEEHSLRESNPTITSGMGEFQNATRHCSLLDLPAHGPTYTWSNRRIEGIISKKLDRTPFNDHWLTKFPHSYSVFEGGGCSDHLRCRIILTSVTNRAKRPFKFVNVVAELEGFLPLVSQYWQKTDHILSSTSSLYRFSKKLKNLKPEIRVLAKEGLGNLTVKCKEAYEDLCAKQEQCLQHPSGSNAEAENIAYARWDKVSSLEEKFLKQKSKLHWLNVGDKSNKVFHRAAVARDIQNTIKEVVCSDGRTVYKPDEIKEEAEGFFRDFLQHKPPEFEGIELDELRNLLPFRCSNTVTEMLVKEVTAEEITKVVFTMPSDKSPGPDGYTIEFFKSAWTIIGEEFITSIQSFFEKGFLPKGINSTILTLIPKRTTARGMSDYRPISCCNVIYKVISKLIANRLKLTLPNFVALNQSAFVKGRLLIENLLLATELVKDYHKDTVSKRCTLKIDISKAFDSVQWSFLLKSLEAMNFPTKFIHWISLCITTASFSVQVNGELAGYFQSERGLRQGCALSPYLFVICMDVLSKLLDKSAQQHQFGYHPKCKNMALTHLSFADDIMVFTDGRVRSIESILEVFNYFARVSGLTISTEKSTIFYTGMTVQEKQTLLDKFNFGSGTLPVRYLGLPLLSKRMNKEDYKILIEKIKQRIGLWTNRFLSIAGRLQLIKSVLMNIVNFWMTGFKLPGQCIKEINSYCSAFLWSGPNLNVKKSKVCWDAVCTPKREGGLGLRSLKEMNKALCLKLLWRFLSSQPSLWTKWIQVYLIKRESFWSIKNTTSAGSWMWRKLLQYRDIAKDFHKMKVGDGHQTSFWFDSWSTLGRLIDLTGVRGCIDLGLRLNATVSMALHTRRRRIHRVDVYNNIESVIEEQRPKMTEGPDFSVWKSSADTYKPVFHTRNTWNLIRHKQPLVNWYRGVWFKHHTPKYAFFAWLAILNRLNTGDRMLAWNRNVDASCIFCNQLETRDHLFFSCPYSASVWTQLMSGLLGTRFTTIWGDLMVLTIDNSQDMLTTFLTRYGLQVTIHSLWRERNDRCHGASPKTITTLVAMIDKHIRNRCSSIRQLGDKNYDASLGVWFAAH